jgi:hypothetical protein
MMRLSFALWWALMVFWMWTHNLGAQPGPSALQHAPRTVSWPDEVVAFGTSSEIARENAFKQVQKMLVEAVPLRVWRPSEDYIRKNVFAGPGREKKAEEMTPEELSLRKELGQTVYALVVPLRPVNADGLRRVDDYYEEQQDREGRVSSRLLLLGKIHLALVLALTLATAHTVLDTWTSKRYTLWLRLAALSLLVAGGAGLWLLP